MAELNLVLLEKDVNERTFDCGNEAINKMVIHSYYATISQQGYAFKIMYGNTVVGYYMVTIKNIEISDCPDDVSNYFQDDFGTELPSVYIEYLAIDQKYQRHGIGTNVLKIIIKKVRDVAERFPIRLITIDSVPTMVNWYKKEGFLEMAASKAGQEEYNIYMYLDCIKNIEELKRYSKEKIDQLL